MIRNSGGQETSTQTKANPLSDNSTCHASCFSEVAASDWRRVHLYAAEKINMDCNQKSWTGFRVRQYKKDEVSQNFMKKGYF